MTLSLGLLLTMLVVVMLGTAAGLITTIAGFGGGMVLSLSLAPWLGPAAALVVSSPALALGHLHRSYVYRERIDYAIARRFVLGAAPAAVVGGLLAAWVPEPILGVALLLGASLAVAQARGWIPADLGRRALIPGAAGVGFLAASCGGGGVLLPPTLMSAGLRGRDFVATAASGALVVQCVRITTYASAGMVTLEHSPLMLGAGLGLLAGNVLGRRAAVHFDDAKTARWTRGILAFSVVLGLLTVLSQGLSSLSSPDPKIETCAAETLC